MTAVEKVSVGGRSDYISSLCITLSHICTPSHKIACAPYCLQKLHQIVLKLLYLFQTHIIFIAIHMQNRCLAIGMCVDM